MSSVGPTGLTNGLNWRGEKPADPQVGDCYYDQGSSTVFVYSEVEHTVLDDIVAAVDDRDPRCYEWLPVMGSLGPTGVQGPPGVCGPSGGSPGWNSDGGCQGLQGLPGAPGMPGAGHAIGLLVPPS